jgi:hypothetical protein
MSQMRKHLNNKERDTIKGVLEGTKNIDANQNQKILQRPHVAVAFEVLLDNMGLSDDKLAKKIKEIIKREPAESVNPKTGSITTNQTSVDANALNAIRTIWQITGKFVDKKEVHHTGGISEMDDSQLDKIIESGSTFISFKKNQINHAPQGDISAQPSDTAEPRG